MVLSRQTSCHARKKSFSHARAERDARSGPWPSWLDVRRSSALLAAVAGGTPTTILFLLAVLSTRILVMASSQGAGYRVEVIRCITRYVSLRAIRATVEARAVTESIRRAELASLPDKAMLLLVPGQISRCCQSVKVSSQKCQSQKP